MDYDHKTCLWQRPENHVDLARKAIVSLALPIKDTDNSLYTLSDPREESLTMIKIEYDEINKRTLIRTETTPNTKPPQKLVRILEEQDFEKIN